MAATVAEALPQAPAIVTRESLDRASRAKAWVLALSTIRLDFGTTIETLGWTINAYNLSFAVLLLTGAALGDRFGRRRIFVLGLTVFTAASIACALAPDVNWLIAARAVQGAGGSGPTAALDGAGLVLASASALAAVWGLSRANVAGWTSLAFEAHALIVLTVKANAISALTVFVDRQLVTKFGLPEKL